MPIEVVPYDPLWPTRFERTRSDLVTALAAVPIRAIEHIGSTSVPALDAKPVLDIDVVVEDIPAWLGAKRLPATAYAVIVTRGHKHDIDALRALVHGPLRYVGLIGSRAKVKRIFDVLRAEGTAPETLKSVHAPIGLDIGAITPQEIAVSILAELIAVKHGKIAESSVAAVSMRWEGALKR